jgi:hypothetical protein
MNNPQGVILNAVKNLMRSFAPLRMTRSTQDDKCI